MGTAGTVSVKEKRSRQQPAVRSGAPAGNCSARSTSASSMRRAACSSSAACRRQHRRDRALARAGKPTIYARFPDKVALFTAVVMRNVAVVTGRFAGHVPMGTTVEQRLTRLGAPS